jgi:hypothetical protein
MKTFKERIIAMKEAWTLIVIMAIIFILGTLGFAKKEPVTRLFQTFSLNSLADTQPQSGVTFDSKTSADGQGALQLHSQKETHFQLITLNRPDVGNSRLFYQAKLKTKGVNGRTYLEMTAFFPGNEQPQTQSVVTGLDENTNWTTNRVPFFFQKGDRPEKLVLGVVMEGKGTAWIDDIQLQKASL